MSIPSISKEEPNPLSSDHAVRERYSAAAVAKQPELCCPVDYDKRYLDVIPQEIIERDYGCGDPSRHVQSGETVLDLGSGGGKICYIAAQVVGSTGRVIGVDCNDDMLQLAREHQPAIAKSLGYDNVEFRKGRIQDLQLNLERLEEYLRVEPIRTSNDWLRAEDYSHNLRETEPLVASNSVDVVVSNCVLNLVRMEDRLQLFREMYRVLNRGGRAVISDIVSDEDVPLRLQNDHSLWSGCISGAFREDKFLAAFENAGFYGIEVVQRQDEPWAIVEGIEFRSVTIRAYKGKEGPCLDRRQAVIYNGPWKAVVDDDGHTLYRGQRMAVCDKTYTIYTRSPYAESITPVPPRELIPVEQASKMTCLNDAVRSPQETKAGSSLPTVIPDGDCCSGDSCC